jgi:muramoyltetrapeptide carboxypeptidase
MLPSLQLLEKGSLIDVIAPASACSRRELAGGVRYLEGLGFKVRVSEKIFGKTKILANTDVERFRQLKAALTANDSAAIWCVRGGYGAVRLLPELSKMKKPRTFKWLLGYSDITTLHWYLNSQWGWPTLHSPLLCRFGRNEATPTEKKEIKSILLGPRAIFTHKLKAMNSAAKKTTRIRSSIIGGNLTVLQGSLGTRWAFDGSGHFVFFEDIGERPHRMDRMLTQMAQSGVFKNARAIIFGDMVGLKKADERLLWSNVLPRFAEAQKIPVLRGLKAGHGEMQHIVPFLTRSTLLLGRQPQLQMEIS